MRQYTNGTNGSDLAKFLNCLKLASFWGQNSRLDGGFRSQKLPSKTQDRENLTADNKPGTVSQHTESQIDPPPFPDLLHW